MRGCVGTGDRVLRILIGIAALVVGIALPGAVGATWAYVADAAGVVALLTGLVGYCPLYALFGVRTCRKPA
jgi:hypothetical protein